MQDWVAGMGLSLAEALGVSAHTMQVVKRDIVVWGHIHRYSSMGTDT